MVKMRKNGWIALLACGWIGWAVLAGAQEVDFETLQTIGAVGQGLFEQIGSSGMLEGCELQSPEQIMGAFRALAGGLEGGSLEQLVRYRPQARQVVALAREVPMFADYAAWLEARLDYFDLSAELLSNERRVQAAAAQRRRGSAPAAPPRTGSQGGQQQGAGRKPPAWQVVSKDSPEARVPAKTPATKPAAIPPAVPAASPAEARAEARELYAADKEVWRKKLAGQPVPAGAREYAPKLQRIFAEEGVPQALVWQAEAESGFRAAAKSPVGAVGMFQFMPATASEFGLASSPDERLDPEKSARAAARYLKRLHGRFGDWALALAAYNCGEGRLGKLLAKTDDKTFPGIRAQLPVETRMYVPKIAVLMQLRDNADLDAL
jgi:membrane-bound lytic murein transglycosylase D